MKLQTFSHGVALSSLAMKMVSVLESTEKFPQYLYDTPGGSAFGLQLLSRRIRMKLEHAISEHDDKKQLINRFDLCRFILKPSRCEFFWCFWYCVAGLW